MLKVGADDASSGNSEKPISPRMLMNGMEEKGKKECLPATVAGDNGRLWMDGGVKTGDDAVFEG